jgi:hypothetical protein
MRVRVVMGVLVGSAGIEENWTRVDGDGGAEGMLWAVEATMAAEWVSDGEEDRNLLTFARGRLDRN